jgi:hypothetical protein
VQPLQRGLLDLPHVLGAYPQRLGDLAQRLLRRADAKARADDGSLTIGETGEKPRARTRSVALS